VGSALTAVSVLPRCVEELSMKHSRAFLVEVCFLVAAMVPMADAARGEGFVDLYVGGAFTADADGTGNMGVGTGTPLVPQSFEMEFVNAVTGGGRGGYWLESVPWLGFALDASQFTANEAEPPGGGRVLKLRVVPLSGLLMLRYPLLKSGDFPRGQVYTYAGVGPGAFLTRARGDEGNLGVVEDFADDNVDVGIDARVGVKLFHNVAYWGLFLEYRFTYFQPSEFTDDLAGERFEIELDQLATHHAIFGIGFHF